MCDEEDKLMKVVKLFRKSIVYTSALTSKLRLLLEFTSSGLARHYP